MRPLSPFFLAILLVGFFGAGAIDVFFADVVPLRPYDGMIRWTMNFSNSSPSQGIKTVFTILLLILVLSAGAAAVANSTTGITIAHTGFTPNINLTRTNGLTGLTQALPLVFLGAGIGYVLDEMGSVL